MEDWYLKLARIGYQAYGEEAKWKNWQGLPMPNWEDLPENIKIYWTKAAKSIAEEVSER